MIVNQNVHWAVLINDTLPRFFRLRNICKIGLVKMDVFDVYIASDSLGILDKLRRQVVADINDNQVDTADLVPSYKLLG